MAEDREMDRLCREDEMEEMFENEDALVSQIHAPMDPIYDGFDYDCFDCYD
jgi:hypothetical protein